MNYTTSFLGSPASRQQMVVLLNLRKGTSPVLIINLFIYGYLL